MSLLNKWNRNIAHIVSAKGEALVVGRTRLKIVRSVCLVLMALVVIVIIDCNTKMFSNMVVEGNSNGNLMANNACPNRSSRCGGGCS